MKDKESLCTIDCISFYDISKLELHEASLLVRRNGILLDTDVTRKLLVHLYYFNGYFVEEAVCRRTHKPVEIIPFKRGYRLESFLSYPVSTSQN